MIRVDRCVVCDGPVTIQRTSLVAPFLAHKIWDRSPFLVYLVKCEGCGFLFYNPRFEQHEENRLYEGYRSEAYQQMRFKHEPWYTEAFNKRLSAQSRAIDSRRHLLLSILTQYAIPQDMESVLDFGGDKGQLIEQLPFALKYVYDISSVAARKGIMAFSDFADCAKCQYDLIVCSHVLEHASFPKKLLSQMRGVAHSGTLLFLEVPLESPLSLACIVKRLCQTLILALTRPRNAMAYLHPCMLFLMHEHLNFYSAKSLRTLVELTGFHLVAAGRYCPKSSLLLRSDSIWCLARLK